jgi:hypothetical protein
MKKLTIMSIILTSVSFSNNSLSASDLNDCTPTNIAPLLRQGQHSNDGDFHFSGRSYGLLINGEKSLAFDATTERAFRTAQAVRIQTEWDPASNPSFSFCKVYLTDEQGNFTEIRLFPQATTHQVEAIPFTHR